jgi:succinate dehydrogenase flavin-adding protein (antitoxin of CptAB toxin-antitoxin module)
VDRVARERLKWKCRRGLLELDLVLERYLERHGVQEAEAAPFGELLELPDNDLWEIVCGRSDRFDARCRDIVARLRAC